MRRVMAVTALATGLLVGDAFSGTPSGSAPEERLEEARAALVAGLEEYADWCGAGRLHAERARVWTLIVALDPENEGARLGLGHKKGSRGNWLVPRSAREREYVDEGPLDAARERYAGVVAPFVARAEALLDEADLPEPVRTAAVADLLRIDPDNARARASRGEVRSAGGWVPKETASGIQRRRELAAVAQAALTDADEGAGARGIAPNERERGFGLAFHAVASPEVRVLATASEEEAIVVQRSLHAAARVFAHVFDADARLPLGCTVYLLGRDGEKPTFLGRHPDLDADQRAILARLDGAGVPGTGDWAHWASDPAKRRDAIVHMAIAWFLGQTFGIGIEHGWAFEGFGLYLTAVVTGTRLTWFVPADPDVDPRRALAGREHLLDPATNWMQEALERLSDDDEVERLALAMRKRADELDMTDLLCCYAFAAYLVEGRPDDAAELLRRTGAGEDPDDALRAALGAGPDALQRRLLAWMERRGTGTLAAPVDAARLHAAWATLDGKRRSRVVAAFLRRVERLGTDQLRALRRIVEAEGDAPAGWPLAAPAAHYDPRTHAPADPIRRRLLEADDPKVRRVLRELHGPPDPRELVASYRYDWGTGEIVRAGDPDDVEAIFANAANGYPPGLDLARAVVMRELDRGEERPVLAAFDHAYTDREGGVYPGTTLFDAWKSKGTIEMPDVDVLGLVHDVLDEWQRWKAPVSAADHGSLYQEVERLFRRARDYREPREVLADTYLIGEPVDRRGYGDVLTNLQALWAVRDGRVAAVAQELPGAAGWTAFLVDWIERCKSDPDRWNAGRQRAYALGRDAERVRAALVEAMEEVGVLDEGGATR